MNAKKRISTLVYLISVILALSIIQTGCQSGANGQQITEGYLKIAGSTTVEPAALAAAEAYMTQFPNIEITVRGGGSSIGIEGVVTGALHIGMISRPIKEAELAKQPALTATTIGYDGVAVVIHKSLYDAGVTQLTLEQVANIWLGKITNWQEVGGPNLPIIAYDKELGRGTRDIFAKIVLGDEDAAAPGTIGSLGPNEAVLSAVSNEPGAVSILSTGWQTSDVVGVAIVDEDGRVAEPTPDNVESGLYPISRDLSLVTNGPATGLAAQFIDFMLSAEGQAFVKETGYSPISEE